MRQPAMRDMCQEPDPEINADQYGYPEPKCRQAYEEGFDDVSLGADDWASRVRPQTSKDVSVA